MTHDGRSSLLKKLLWVLLLLHGLQRVGKDWRPVVPGMTRPGS